MRYAPLVRCGPVLLAFAFAGFACSSFGDGNGETPATDGGGLDGSATNDGGDGDVGDDGSNAAASPYARAVLDAKPLLYWRLGETTGPDARDQSGNMLDGAYAASTVLLGQPSLVGDGDPSVQMTAGGSIDGPIDARLAFVDNAPFSVECWISFSTTPTGSQAIVTRASAAAESGWTMTLENGTRAYFTRYENAQGVMHATDESTPITADTPHHLVGVYDGTSLRIHLDGISDGFSNDSVKLVDHGYRVHVGRDVDAPGKLTTRVDEVAVYPYALNPETIAAHHAIGRRDR